GDPDGRARHNRADVDEGTEANHSTILPENELTLVTGV
ncbi:MAG: hypothetical protein RLZZ319_640, partial [Actinomycetota bacterium]